MPWASGPWAGPTSALLRVVAAVASAENAVQVRFSQPPYVSGLFDAADALDPSHYAIAIVAGTRGADGNPTRSVAPVSVVVVDVDQGDVLELTLDRSMTPFPSQYSIACSGLYTLNLAHALDPNAAVASFAGVARALSTYNEVKKGRSQDLSGEPDLALLYGGVPGGSLAPVAGIAVAPNGDYAGEDGDVAYKRRMHRILITQPGAYLHLGDDFGAAASLKKTLRPGEVAQQLSRIETQVRRDPETDNASVRLEADPTAPGLVRTVLLARRKGGKRAFKLTAPIRFLGE